MWNTGSCKGALALNSLALQRVFPTPGYRQSSEELSKWTHFLMCTMSKAIFV